MTSSLATPGDLRAPSSKRRRNQAVEALRILAAFGIVVFHGGGAWAGYFYTGLIVFVVLSPMIDAHYNWDRQRPVAVLARSLLIPWGFWLAVYAVFDVARHKPVLPSGNPLLGILAGTSVHLWFLPFIFLVLVALGRIKRHVRPPLAFLGSAVLLLAILGTAEIWRPMSQTWPQPLPQWIHAIGAVFAGAAIGLTARADRLRIPGLALIAAALLIAIYQGVSGVALTYGLGIPLTTAAVFLGKHWWPARWSVQPVADCMMGVYLIHPILLSVAGVLAAHGTLLQAAIAFLLSFALIFTARRLVPRSKLVLG